MKKPLFYTVSHNTFATRGFPWIQNVSGSFRIMSRCKSCNRALHYADGEIALILERDKGTKWTDILGCGAFPFFIISQRAVNAFKDSKIGSYPMNMAKIINHLPKNLSDTTPPKYFWLDGKQMRGASIDFEASGYVDVSFCPECGTRTNDISATYDRQRLGEYSGIVLSDGSWNGQHLFTSDISETRFFCTEELVNCATEYKLDNFCFIPIEKANISAYKGLKYK